MKIPIFCSLLPTELIIKCGFEPHYIANSELRNQTDCHHTCAFHENLCSYSKALYDFFLKHESEFSLIIIPTACDALKKLHNSLQQKICEKKLYLLDIPQSKALISYHYLAKELTKLEAHLNTLAQDISLIPNNRNNYHNLSSMPETQTDAINSNKIGVLGANVFQDTIKQTLNHLDFSLFPLNDCLHKAYFKHDLFNTLISHNIQAYAEQMFTQNSCPRTNDDTYKNNLLHQIHNNNIKGLIFNIYKFCDFQPFDFKYLKQNLDSNFPILMIEHELTAANEGQLMTRIDAFLEKIQQNIKKSTPKKRSLKQGNFFVGIDSGSHATKLVCIDHKGEILAHCLIDTSTSVKQSADYVLNELETKHHINKKQIACLTATGYGRNQIKGADNIVTEISCHALGAHHILQHKATIIDIGGQDSKAIKFDEQGQVQRFAMNDKCAAGTGRFLEVMSEKLKMNLDDFSQLALQAKRSVPISSMCSVFAESEVISLIAAGSPKEEIAKGIHQAIAERTIGLTRRIKGEPPYFMAGGVARNKGLVNELAYYLNSELRVLPEPQFSGALGAALMGRRD